MHTQDTLKKLVGWSASATIIMAVLAGCEPKAAAEPPKPTPPSEVPGPVGAELFGSHDAVGGIILLANGNVVVVDAKGTRLDPCRLSDPEMKQNDSAEYAECQKVSDTTITNIQSFAVVQHTGSKCFSVGPAQSVSGGGVQTGSAVYQVPPGCTN